MHEPPVGRPPASRRADAVACALRGRFSSALVALLRGRAWRARRPTGPRELVLASLAAVAAFASLGKVLSPQFMIWVLPLAALAFAWRMHALAATLSRSPRC